MAASQREALTAVVAGRPRPVGAIAALAAVLAAAGAWPMRAPVLRAHRAIRPARTAGDLRPPARSPALILAGGAEALKALDGGSEDDEAAGAAAVAASASARAMP